MLIPDVYISMGIDTSVPLPTASSVHSIGSSVVGYSTTSFYAEWKPISEQVVSKATKVVGTPLENFTKNRRDSKVLLEEFEE